MSTLHFCTDVDVRTQRAPRRAGWTIAVAALLCMAPVAACGGDDDDASSTPTAGTSGSGAAGSRAGSSGSAGAATPAPQPVSCGSATCNPPTNPLTSLLSSFGGGVMGLPTPVACCLDESAGKCGVAMGAGAMCEAPAVADPRCPGIAAGGLAGGMNTAGCCIANACGQDGSLFGRGCVENSEAKGMLSAIPLVGSLLTIPPSRACDAPPVVTNPSGGDAGVEDAGI